MKHLYFTRERDVMKPTAMKIAAVCAALAWTGVLAARTPAAYKDSAPATLDTRIGAVTSITVKELDTRTGSWDVTDFGFLDTLNSPGISIIIR